MADKDNPYKLWAGQYLPIINEPHPENIGLPHGDPPAVPVDKNRC